MPIKQINPDGSVKIYNTNTGEEKDVSPQDLGTYNPRLINDYQAIQAVQSGKMGLSDVPESQKVSTAFNAKSTAATDKEKTRFDSAIKEGLDRLKKGEDWGTVWNGIRANFNPDTISNNLIDASLGTQWRKPSAYEIMTNKANPGEEPYTNLPQEDINNFYGITQSPHQSILDAIKSRISDFVKKKIVPEPGSLPENKQTRIQSSVSSAQLTPSDKVSPARKVFNAFIKTPPGRVAKGFFNEPGESQPGSPESFGEAVAYSPIGALAIGSLKIPKIMSKGVKLVPTDKLFKYVGRGGFRTPEQLATLRKDIEKNGIKKPVEITINEKGVPEIYNGNQRVKIAKELGIKEIPVKIVEDTTSTAKIPQTQKQLTAQLPQVPQEGLISSEHPKISSLPDIISQEEKVYQEQVLKELAPELNQAHASQFGDYQEIAKKMQTFLKSRGETTAKDSRMLYREHIPSSVFGVSSDEVATTLGISENEFMNKIMPEVIGRKATPKVLKTFGRTVQRIKEMAEALKLDKDFYKTIEGFNPTELGTIPSYKNIKPYRLPGGVTIEPTEETLTKIAEKENLASVKTQNQLFKDWQNSYKNETLSPSQKVGQLEKQIRQATNDGINDKLKQNAGDVTIFDYVRTPENVFRKLGLSDPFVALRKATSNYEDELKTELQRIGGWFKEVKGIKGSSQNIFDYLDGQPIKLSTQELKVATEIKDYLAKFADRQGLAPDRRITDYITHIFEPELNKQQIPPELLQALNYAPPRGVFNPFLEKRLGASGYVRDVWRALDTYTTRGLRKIHLDQPIDNFGAYVNHLPDGAQQYTNSFLNYIVGRPDKLESLMDQTLKTIGKHLPNETIKRYLAVRPTKKIFGEAQMAVFRGALGLNVKSALKNLTQGINTFAEEGAIATIKGYMSLFNRSNLSEIEKQNLISEMITAEHRNKPVKNAIGKIDKVLLGLFDLAERINRGAAYFASKSNSLQKGLSEEEAQAQALSQVRKTQFGYGKIDIPLMLQNPIAKAGFQFSSFPIKQAELLGGMVKNKEYMKVARYVMATLGVTWALGNYLGLDWKDAIVRNVMPGLGPIPSTLGAGIGLLKAKTEQQTEEAKKNLKSSAKILLPAGLSIFRAIEGAKAYSQGATKTVGGKIKYRIEKTLPNLIKSILLGPNSTPGAQKYFDKLNQPAKKKFKKLSELPDISSLIPTAYAAESNIAKTLPPINQPSIGNDLSSVISSAAESYAVPIKILSSLIQQESGGKPDAESPVGARGIAQFMPETAKQYGVDVNDPVSSIKGAAHYLSDLYKQFGSWELALAGYNAGPGAVQKYGGIPPYAETQNYVRSILAMAH